MYAGGRNAQGCLYLTVYHKTILHYQFTHAVLSMFSGTTAVLEGPLRILSLSERRPGLK